MSTTSITNQELVLSKPLVTNTSLKNVTIRIADDFVPYPTAGAAPLRWCVYMKDPKNILVEDVIIEAKPTWETRWNNNADLSPGICAGLGGILMHRAVDCTINNIKVSGLPGVALQVNGATNSSIRNIETARTLMGVRVGPDQSSSNVIVENVLVGDTWEPLLPGYTGKGQSLKYPGARTGGDCFVATNTTQLYVRNYKMIRGSEGKGLKLNSVLWAKVEDVELPNLQVQGIWEGNPPGQPSLGILLDRCLIDRTLTYREAEPSMANGIHLHTKAQHVWIQRSDVKSDGGGGHGIWVDDCQQIRVASNTITAWNGSRGGRPGHGIAVVRGGTLVNDVVKDNTFINQNNILLIEP